MGKAPAEQFYWQDWSRDLEEHPLEIEGAWIRLCCKLWYSETRGEASKSLDQWSRILRVHPEKAQEILSYIGEENIGNINNPLCEENVRSNGKITVTCRRMVREDKARKSNRLRQKRHYEKLKRKPNAQPNGNLTPPSSSSSSSSTSKPTSCPELKDNSGPPPEVIMKIPLSKKEAFFDVTKEHVNKLSDSFPGVNVLLELKQCRQWNIDNPKRRKTPSGIRTHISGWMGKAQNSFRGNKKYGKPDLVENGDYSETTAWNLKSFEDWEPPE